MIISNNEKQLELTKSLPTLMDQRTLASYLSKSPSWCERARWDGSGPKFIKCGKAVRYRASDVLDWIESHVCNSTHQTE